MEAPTLLGLDNKLFIWRKRIMEDLYEIDNYFKRIICDSKSGNVYILKIENGELVCNCEGFKHRHTCRHVRKAQDLRYDYTLKQSIDSSLKDNYCRWCGLVFNKTDNYCGSCGKKRG
jgi:uncharacterized protein YegP (UPF0339 family)